MTTIMNSDWAVEAHGLVKTFGDNRAVDGIDLSVRTGVHNCWDFHYSKRKVPGPRRLDENYSCYEHDGDVLARWSARFARNQADAVKRVAWRRRYSSTSADPSTE